MKNYFVSFYICYLALRRILREHYTYQASALAFTTLLGLVPLLTITVYVISFFSSFTDFMDYTRNYLFANFIPSTSSHIESYLELFVEQAKKLPGLSLIFLFVTTGLFIVTMDHSFESIWHQHKNPKKYISWLIYWIMILVIPLFIGISLFIATYVASLAWYKSYVSWIPLLTLVPLLINTIIFTTIYIIVPNVWLRWRDGLLGGFVAALLFEVIKIAFAFYVHLLSNYEVIYGALSAIPIMLLWVYVSWLIILYGALITNVQYQFRTHSHQKSH